MVYDLNCRELSYIWNFMLIWNEGRDKKQQAIKIIDWKHFKVKQGW